MGINNFLVVVLMALFLSSCASQPEYVPHKSPPKQPDYQPPYVPKTSTAPPTKNPSAPSDANGWGRYSVDNDYTPDVILNPDDIIDAVPTNEQPSKYGNKSPYTVLGKTYKVLPSAKGYKEKGGASWYGLKFDGHKTSNGEIYSVYGMTAAHKTLPIPSYAKVTNTTNNRSVVVRVNDRGPFHEGRIIDLSYAAATKLGYLGAGTTQVIVEAIDPANYEPSETVYSAAPINSNANVYLQVGAYKEEVVALSVYKTLYAKYTYPVNLESGKDQYHRIKIGPVLDSEVEKISTDLQNEGFPAPMRLK